MAGTPLPPELAPHARAPSLFLSPRTALPRARRQAPPAASTAHDPACRPGASSSRDPPGHACRRLPSLPAPAAPRAPCCSHHRRPPPRVPSSLWHLAGFAPVAEPLCAGAASPSAASAPRSALPLPTALPRARLLLAPSSALCRVRRPRPALSPATDLSPHLPAPPPLPGRPRAPSPQSAASTSSPRPPRTIPLPCSVNPLAPAQPSLLLGPSSSARKPKSIRSSAHSLALFLFSGNC
ncbi:hypothetical protein BRADI_3g25633v3 [Brachypodium distachyon]|uniref:Uncharacterized protein n=1 Tax=Brachypodium distachyon TaxID=15368 RepID=A0A0Q3JE87_BRADI|nr:hypothetical protein BRADI_3g25633v3 [Brachypodium distachyon]